MKAFAIGAKESGEQALSWAGQHGLTYPVVAEPQGEIFRRFGAAVPYHVVIGRDLRIALSKEAFEKDSLIRAIEDVIKFKGRKRNDL